MSRLYEDTDDYFDEPPARRIDARCQCDGEAVGPCPGPANCPNCGDDDDEDV